MNRSIELLLKNLVNLAKSRHFMKSQKSLRHDLDVEMALTRTGRPGMAGMLVRFVDNDQLIRGQMLGQFGTYASFDAQLLSHHLLYVSPYSLRQTVELTLGKNGAAVANLVFKIVFEFLFGSGVLTSQNSPDSSLNNHSTVG